MAGGQTTEREVATESGPGGERALGGEADAGVDQHLTHLRGRQHTPGQRDYRQREGGHVL